MICSIKACPHQATNCCPKRQHCRAPVKVAVSGNNLLPFAVFGWCGQALSVTRTAPLEWRIDCHQFSAHGRRAWFLKRRSWSSCHTDRPDSEVAARPRAKLTNCSFAGFAYKSCNPRSSWVISWHEYARINNYTVPGKKESTVARHNFDKFRRSFVIFGTNHPDISVY